MFGRIVEFTPKPEMKDEIVNVLRNEVLPILRQQPGFVEFLPFVPEAKTGKWITVTLWDEKRDADRWEREGIPMWKESSNSIWSPRPSAITTRWKPPFASTS